MQKLVWEQEAKRHVPLFPVVLHQGYASKRRKLTIIVLMAISFSATHDNNKE